MSTSTIERVQTGGPAFPVGFGPDGRPDGVSSGMDLRDWFAGQALAGFLAGNDPRGNAYLDSPNGRRLDQWVAEAAYDYADAMIAARATPTPEEES